MTKFIAEKRPFLPGPKKSFISVAIFPFIIAVWGRCGTKRQEARQWLEVQQTEVYSNTKHRF